MIYQHIESGIFVRRANRFIAEVLLKEIIHFVHVKNTGRCKELLLPGVVVFVEKTINPHRKTAYTLISVYKGKQLINLDSTVPNELVTKELQKGRFSWAQNPQQIRREFRYGHSRFDVYCEVNHQPVLIEVKGVTLEKNGAVFFPDAPTLRGTRHINQLIQATENGYRCHLIFVAQMYDVTFFSPNQQTDPDFTQALRQAHQKNVGIQCFDCIVTPTQIDINCEIPIHL